MLGRHQAFNSRCLEKIELAVFFKFLLIIKIIHRLSKHTGTAPTELFSDLMVPFHTNQIQAVAGRNQLNGSTGKQIFFVNLRIKIKRNDSH